MHSSMYSIIVRHPKFRFAESVPEFIVGTISLKTPLVDVEYVYSVEIDDKYLWNIHYVFSIYRSGVGKYYIEIKNRIQNIVATLGFIFKLSRDEVIEFFNKITTFLRELYRDEVTRLLKYIRAALTGAKINEEIMLFDSHKLREIYPPNVHIVEKFSVRTR